MSHLTIVGELDFVFVISFVLVLSPFVVGKGGRGVCWLELDWFLVLNDLLG